MSTRRQRALGEGAQYQRVGKDPPQMQRPHAVQPGPREKHDDGVVVHLQERQRLLLECQDERVDLAVEQHHGQGGKKKKKKEKIIHMDMQTSSKGRGDSAN